MVNEDGDLGFHDLDHSAGRLDQNDPFNAGDVVEGALTHMKKTASYMNLVDNSEEIVSDIVDEAKQIAEERGDEVRQLLEETDDPHISEMLKNILYNIETIEDAELQDASALGNIVEVDL